MKIVPKNPVSFVSAFKSRLNSWNTPDYLARKGDNHIPMMFLDNTRIGGANHSLVEKHDFLGEGVTVSERYQMRESAVYDDVMFAKIEDKQWVKNQTVGSSIVGDIFVVDPITLCELDRFYQNTYMFNRIQTWVWALDQKSQFKDKSKCSMKVWVYVQNDEFWRTKVFRICAPKTKTTKGRFVYDFDAEQDYKNSKMYGYLNQYQEGWSKDQYVM